MGGCFTRRTWSDIGLEKEDRPEKGLDLRVEWGEVTPVSSLADPYNFSSILTNSFSFSPLRSISLGPSPPLQTEYRRSVLKSVDSCQVVTKKKEASKIC